MLKFFGIFFILLIVAIILSSNKEKRDAEEYRMSPTIDVKLKNFELSEDGKEMNLIVSIPALNESIDRISIKEEGSLLKIDLFTKVCPVRTEEENFSFHVPLSDKITGLSFYSGIGCYTYVMEKKDGVWEKC